MSNKKNEFYEHYLNKNQHLIDRTKNKLDYNQKELLRYFLTSDMFFIPFTIDGDWSFEDSMNVIDKIELAKELLSGRWHFDVSAADLEDEVYMIDIYLESEEIREKFLKGFFKNKPFKKVKSYIELYVRYLDMLAIYKKSILNSKCWPKIIHKEDI